LVQKVSSILIKNNVFRLDYAKNIVNRLLAGEKL